MSAAPADVELVRAAQAGDRDAFSALYDRYSRMVHGMLLARVPPADADDLLQDVFISAMRKIAELREPAAFGGWLAAITRNRARDYYRRSAEHVELTHDVPMPESQSADVEVQAVLEKLEALPHCYRETLILRLVEGMSGPEIAERTGLTPGSVRVNLHRGMKMLREILGTGVPE